MKLPQLLQHNNPSEYRQLDLLSLLLKSKCMVYISVLMLVSLVWPARGNLSWVYDGRFTFERIHDTKEQICFDERAENHKAKERMFKSFK